MGRYGLSRQVNGEFRKAASKITEFESGASYISDCFRPGVSD